MIVTRLVIGGFRSPYSEREVGVCMQHTVEQSRARTRHSSAHRAMIFLDF